MATAEQIKALLQSHAQGDDDRFLSISMQIAAHAARRGQGKLAEEIRGIIDQAKARQDHPAEPVPIVRPSGELAGLIAASYPKQRLSDMVLDAATREHLDCVVTEYRQRHRLHERGLSPRRKLLLIGPPGTGKTMTGAALAGELHLPLLSVRLESVLTKYLGETAAKLRLIFDAMTRTPAVYFFDEFDAIGSDRGQSNDVGEIRRILNSFLQFLEQDNSDSLIVAATNFVGLLDLALFRRFDDVIEYELPEPEHAEQLIRNRLAGFGIDHLAWAQMRPAFGGLSYAELARACDQAAKDAVLADEPGVSTTNLLRALKKRRRTHRRKREGGKRKHG
jgi:SpoVK/Ycf46/Vps4 family AAA+-type ATPase